MPALTSYTTPANTAILTAAQLRERIGGPVALDVVDGFVREADLQQIVDEGRASLFSMALNAAREMFEAGKTLLVGEPVSLFVEPSGFYAGLCEAAIPALYFPFAFRLVAADGMSAEYDPGLFSYRTSPFKPFKYVVEGRRVSFLCPYGAPEAVTVVLAAEDDAIAVLAGAEVSKVNSEMVGKGERMLARRIAEQTRISTQDVTDDA